MNEFNEAFEPIYNLTLAALQKEQLAMSDLIVLWYKRKRDLHKLDSETNELVAPLIEAFDRRTEALMQNPLLATAAYVDPRFNHETRSSKFLGDMKEIAENRIRLVVKRIMELDPSVGIQASSTIDSEREDNDNIDQFIELEVARNATETRRRTID
ncbi:hypothetical protein Bhyg_04223 [Pseudolycoriella hygida]|uniref:Uncharacterized protein n=1 Tax=Pseudolycoriella hygida TaxID=35572 RepID=A0A9Q0NGA2_9DIPT|nr:hypothetical protein Bhyg_04223 [Pseudolycoriella hygida]